MQWLIAHWPVFLALAPGVISEIIAVRQQLKYPDNDGFGGILAALLKVLQNGSLQTPPKT